jgi:ABC transporter, permease
LRPDLPAKHTLLARTDARIGLLFVLPALALFLVFRFGPALAGLALSLFKSGVGGPLSWAGFSNFTQLARDPAFWQALSVTLVFVAFSVPISLCLSTLLALGVRRGFRGSRFFRSVFFLPFITSLALVGSVLKWIFSTEGPWSDLMAPFGLGGSWLASTVLVMPAVIVVGVWSRFGYGMLILVAALQEVPQDLEEAALMDGAGAWSRFRHILLPTIRPALFFLAVIEVTFAFQVFDVIYVMTSGGPANASYSMLFLLYDQGFRYSNYGYAAAAGVALFVMTLVVALIQRLFLGRRS